MFGWNGKDVRQGGCMSGRQEAGSLDTERRDKGLGKVVWQGGCMSRRQGAGSLDTEGRGTGMEG